MYGTQCVRCEAVKSPHKDVFDAIAALLTNVDRECNRVALTFNRDSKGRMQMDLQIIDFKAKKSL